MIQYNTIQYNTIQYNTIQYNTTNHMETMTISEQKKRHEAKTNHNLEVISVFLLGDSQCQSDLKHSIFGYC